jgi:regulator of PEP synthase PpsR (kinase-PPPase family)
VKADKEIPIIVVSDATGETAERVARSTLALFPGFHFRFFLHPRIRNPEDLPSLLSTHPDPQAIFFYTFVHKEMRERFSQLLQEKNRKGIDLLDSIIQRLRQFLGVEPLPIPGSQHRWSREYEARLSAIEFTVKHDDGLGINTIHEADLILIGPSRTGKTPISMFLAMQGYRVANIPLVNGELIPPFSIPEKEPLVVGLTIEPDRLYQFREERLRRMRASSAKSLYADPEAIKTELDLARRFYESHAIPVVDVTNKAVEEVAVEILLYYRSRRILGIEEVTKR